MEHRVLAIDLDGTLLSKCKHISKKNLIAIKAYVQSGGLPIITTGRSIVSAKIYANQLEKFTGSNGEYVVAFNGGYIYNTTTQTVESYKISNDICHTIYEYCTTHKLSMWAYTEESLHKNAVHITKHWANPFGRFAKKLKTIPLDDTVQNMSSYKISIMAFDKNKIRAAHQWLKDKFADKLNISFSNRRMLEVNTFGVNKGFALRQISKEINIPLENFAAIGDSHNDLPAFNEVSLPIAVKTHSQKLIRIAKYYLPYKRNAVADAINKYILNDEKNEIKLVLSDLDGTLLRNGSKTISTKTIKSIVEAVDNHGLYFAVASGRNVDDALLVLDSIKVKNKNRLFIIAANGTVIHDPSKKKYIFQETIEPHLAKEVYESYKLIHDDKQHKGRMALQVYLPNDLATITQPQISYTLNWEYFNEYYSKSHPGMFKHYWAKRNAIPLTDNHDFNNVLKFVFVFESPEDKARVAAAFDKFKTRVEISSSGTHNIEVMPPYITKGSALKHLCAYLNIDVKNTMPIGDELNDISMLNLSNNSVTLKTSKESVRKAAAHVLDYETSDIVGAAIDRYVLDK